MRARLDAIVRLVRAIIGVPDYDRYLRHMRARHPDCRVMTPAEFRAFRLDARYSRPGSRCC
jgi:uncharacterized short protein YbdD (DUF466 family)